MREIKFRAWDGTKYLNEVNVTKCGRMMILENGEYAGQADYPIEQYAGLKDKNGVEIYEGDKVERSDSKESTFIVEFNHAQWCFESYGEFISYPSFYSNAEYMEIIGNIHEEIT